MGFPPRRSLQHDKGHACVAFVVLERVAGIEPAFLAWEATFLPLEDTRNTYQVSELQSPGLLRLAF
jgi:hypothetical protein